MAYLTQRYLHGQFHDLFSDLGQMQDGPPSDLGNFIRGRPPVGHLPPASMTIFLIVVARLVDSFGRLRIWMAKNVDGLGVERLSAHYLSDPHIRELTIDFESLRWTVDMGGECDYEGEHAFLRKDHGYSEDLDGEPFSYHNPRSLAHLIRTNPEDALFGRLSRFPELGLCSGKGYGLAESLDHLTQTLNGERLDFQLTQQAVDELVEAELLETTDDDPRDLPPYRLAEWGRSHSDVLVRFQKLWAEPSNRLWLAALIGDWEAARAAAAASGLDDLASSMQSRVEQSRGESLATLRRRVITVAPWSPTDSTFRALTHLELADLPEVTFPSIVPDRISGRPPV